MKRILAVLMVLCLTLFAFGVPAEASREPVASLSNYRPYQGEPIAITLLHPRPGASYELLETCFDEPIIPFAVDGKLVALVPIRAVAPAGQHNFTVVEILNGVRTEIANIKYEVLRSSFTRQDLTVSSETSALMTAENLQSDREKVNAAKANTADMPLWEGVFIQPLEGRITTQYGQMRYTNGTLTSRHNAYDIAAPQGTPVLAAASGRVVLADGLFVSGNAVIIDHGLWLFTHYYHLHEINVNVGDVVQAGDVIGTVGSTGYSTGPHLHYAAAIQAHNVNPDWFKGGNPLE